ncbi:MAG: NAD(P)H-dependent oxidoreductase [Thermales bacterium]|nr:NAD(P)H-dependent oxidoreductase [Thermales bacterium]
MQIEFFNQASEPLPLLTDDVFKNPVNEVSDFIDTIEDSGGIILATPIYHNSFTGLLKNTLDYLNSQSYKPVGMLSTDSGLRSTQALDALLPVVCSLHMTPIPTRVCATNNDFDENLQITNPKIQDRVELFCDELIWYMEKLFEE